MNEPRVVESVTNECQSLGRAHESSSARAEQLIACLEGEIAKRDETIARLEPQLNRAIQANYDLRAELAALKAQYLELAALSPSSPLTIAAPVSEAKAQGDAWAPSVNDYDHSIHSNPDAREWADFFVATFPGLADKHDLMIGWFANAMMAMHDHLARKAQGVVMDGSQLAGLLEQVRLNDDEAKPHGSGATYWNNAVIACQVAIRDALAAAPAAPAADAGLPYWEPCNPGCDPSFNGCRSVHCSEYCEGAREALVAHRAATAHGGE